MEAISTFAHDELLLNNLPTDCPCNKCSECQRRFNEVNSERGYWKTMHEKAVECISDLKKQNEALKAKIALREKQLFGKKSEKKKNIQQKTKEPKKRRGRQKGAQGKGRKPHKNLPVEEIDYDLSKEEKHCNNCGLPFEEFPGTEDSEEVEYEVKIFRRRHKRKRYKPGCKCPRNRGIKTAKGPDKLIPKGGYGISFWVKVLLDKFLWQTPTYRLIQEFKSHGLNVSQGTITGGFKFISTFLKPIVEKIEKKNQKEGHWHCDETRWMVFVKIPEKENHKWYLWIFLSATTVVFKIVPSRGAKVLKEHFSKESSGIISADRYSAYKAFIKSGKFLIAFCWAHVRRDFLDFAISWPELEKWAFGWVEKIRNIYHLNNQRLQFEIDSPEFNELNLQLKIAIEEMKSDCEAELSDTDHNMGCKKVLKSLKNHWEGLILFVKYPWIPMDNNKGENGLRNPIVGRKGYYGSGAQWSAEFSAMSFTIIQTLLLWEINLKMWFEDYFSECAKNKGNPPMNIDCFLPWNMTDEKLIALGGNPKNIPKAPPKIIIRKKE